MSESAFDGTLICSMSFETLGFEDLLTMRLTATSAAKPTFSDRGLSPDRFGSCWGIHFPYKLNASFMRAQCYFHVSLKVSQGSCVAFMNP